MYTQFGECRSYALGSPIVPDSTKSELAEIASRVMDTPEKECSRLKSSTKDAVLSLVNPGSIFEKPVLSGWLTGLSECRLVFRLTDG